MSAHGIECVIWRGPSPVVKVSKLARHPWATTYGATDGKRPTPKLGSNSGWSHVPKHVVDPYVADRSDVACRRRNRRRPTVRLIVTAVDAPNGVLARAATQTAAAGPATVARDTRPRRRGPSAEVWVTGTKRAHMGKYGSRRSHRFPPVYRGKQTSGESSSGSTMSTAREGHQSLAAALSRTTGSGGGLDQPGRLRPSDRGGVRDPGDAVSAARCG